MVPYDFLSEQERAALVHWEKVLDTTQSFAMLYRAKNEIIAICNVAKSRYQAHKHKHGQGLRRIK